MSHRRWLLLGLVAGLAAAIVAAGLVWPRHDAAKPAAAAPAPSTSTPAPSETPQPVAAPKPAGPPREFVARSVPTKFVLTGRRFTIRATVCSMPPVFPLDPPGEQHHTVCWVTKGFGVKPGSHSGTSYVLGHSWAPDPQEVLNKVSELATREMLRHHKVTLRDGVPTYSVKGLDGYKLILRTATGTLTYKVRDAYAVDKLKLGQVSSTLDAKVRDRIVLITCSELNGVDHPYNIVVNAYLYSSVRV